MDNVVDCHLPRLRSFGQLPDKLLQPVSCTRCMWVRVEGTRDKSYHVERKTRYPSSLGSFALSAPGSGFKRQVRSFFAQRQLRIEDWIIWTSSFQRVVNKQRQKNNKSQHNDELLFQWWRIDILLPFLKSSIYFSVACQTQKKKNIQKKAIHFLRVVMLCGQLFSHKRTDRVAWCLIESLWLVLRCGPIDEL